MVLSKVVYYGINQRHPQPTDEAEAHTHRYTRHSQSHCGAVKNVAKVVKLEMKTTFICEKFIAKTPTSPGTVHTTGGSVLGDRHEDIHLVVQSETNMIMKHALCASRES